MDNYQEILENARKAYDILDLIDLSNDITEGGNLIYNIKITPQYVYNIYGYAEFNDNYRQIGNAVLNYINKIIEKYKIYIDLYNAQIQLKQQNNNMQTTDVVVCNIESYVNILLVLQQSKIIGKVIEEVFK